MNSQNHQTEPDSGTTDSVTSSPPSDHPANHRFPNDETQPRVRFMCSFGGKILPRPHDNQLRYVGGDTRIVAVHRHTSFSSLLNKLSKLAGTPNFSVKYQLPNEDLDALITVTTDEDVENMMEEYDRSAQNAASASAAKASRLRLFLFSNDAVSRSSSISSLLGGSAKREHWFLDALNGGAGPGLERGRSEVSSIVSEVPDYLFGLDNSEDQPREPKLKTRLNFAETVSNSDPGSPAPVVSSRFCSTSSSLAPGVAQSVSDLPPVETKPENPVPVLEHKEAQVESSTEINESLIAQQSGFGGNPGWHYVLNPPYPVRALQQVPVYYVSGPVLPGNVPGQPVSIRAQYVQSFPAPPGQIPAGYNQPIPSMGQVYSGGVRPVTAVDPYEMPARVVPDGANQPLYYGIANAYPGMVRPGGEELPLTDTEVKPDRVAQT